MEEAHVFGAVSFYLPVPAKSQTHPVKSMQVHYNNILLTTPKGAGAHAAIRTKAAFLHFPIQRTKSLVHQQL